MDTSALVAVRDKLNADINGLIATATAQQSDIDAIVAEATTLDSDVLKAIGNIPPPPPPPPALDFTAFNAALTQLRNDVSIWQNQAGLTQAQIDAATAAVTALDATLGVTQGT